MRKRVIYAIVGALLWLALASQGAFVPGVPSMWSGGEPAVFLARIAALVSAVTVFLYGLDKALAMTGAQRRLPERVLLLTGFAGMSAGAFLGQALFNHKMSKPQFQARFMVLNLVLVVLALSLWFIN